MRAARAQRASCAQRTPGPNRSQLLGPNSVPIRQPRPVPSGNRSSLESRGATAPLSPACEADRNRQRAPPPQRDAYCGLVVGLDVLAGLEVDEFPFLTAFFLCGSKELILRLLTLFRADAVKTRSSLASSACK